MQISYHAGDTCYFTKLVQSENNRFRPHPLLIYTVVLLGQQDLLCLQLEVVFFFVLGGSGAHN